MHAACGGGTPEPTLDIEATVQARLKEELEKAAATLEPTAIPAPLTTATFTPVPPTPTAEFEELYNPDETEPAAANSPQETQISDLQIDRAEKQEAFSGMNGNLDSLTVPRISNSTTNSQTPKMW